ncbi:MAG: hypothetical protein EOP83_29145 [Verrucomicrobiaceae bacterium]|nr:MAG: hypothetical protein EOP83_29145 [Verrucomicrobiaceae bacterium]
MEDGTWTEQLTLQGIATTGDAFGFSIALDGKRLLVGAPWDDFLSSPATGNVSPDQGSVFFYEIGSGASVFLGSFDLNHDGLLSPDEWRSIYPTPPKKESAFPLIDSDESGMLDEEELRAVQNAKGVLKTSGIWLDRAEAFVELDTDQDGRVSRAEIEPMWAPGTSSKGIDATWKRLKGGEGIDFPSWIRANSLPPLVAYEKAKALRAERRTLYRMLDSSDESGLVERDEFALFFRSGTRFQVIDAAWRVATGTPKDQPLPGTISLTDFIEAPKLPKSPWK